MQRTVYLNGEYLPESEAKISIFDRGFLFADSVYEVTAVIDGRLIDNEGHLARLKRSCDQLFLSMPVTDDELVSIQKELIKLNNMQSGAIYLQLSRGNEGDRDFTINQGIKPTLVLFTQEREIANNPVAAKGIKIVSKEDVRWKRRDIKTTSLLAACLSKKEASEAGAKDVWLIEGGTVTEGGSSNAYIVKGGKLITRPLSRDILPGITRETLLGLAKAEGIDVEERAFSIDEAYAADEAFISSATTFVWPVVCIDEKMIGSGEPGPISKKLRQLYIEAGKERAQ